MPEEHMTPTSPPTPDRSNEPRNKGHNPNTKAYWRHVRREVQAPLHRFAAIVPPELARVCQQELVALGVTASSVSQAGVEFSGKLEIGYQANLWLRTASRVLCRWPAFRAGVIGELFHKAARLPWELWLHPTIPVKIHTHVQQSRIDHEGLIGETILKALQQRFQCQGMPHPGRAPLDDDHWAREPGHWQQRLFARLENNHCELSLDTTGPHLHQRGYRLQHAGAPLRETLAAAILLKAGWHGDRPLVDGMCGAGTAAIEAALIARNAPPGIRREFLFEKWPAHQQKTYEFLCRKARASMLAQTAVPILALDANPETLAIGRQNAERAGVAEDIHWTSGDLFAFAPHAPEWQPGLLILDPPYGKRQSMADSPRAFYQHIGIHLRQSFKGWQVAVAAPSSDLALALGFKPVRFWKIIHGGSPIIISLAKL
jgi:putative N6-adenine-specific DNA methylase